MRYVSSHPLKTELPSLLSWGIGLGQHIPVLRTQPGKHILLDQTLHQLHGQMAPFTQANTQLAKSYLTRNPNPNYQMQMQ